VVVTGCTSPLGRRVREGLRAAAPTGELGPIEVVPYDGRAATLEGTRVVVHLGAEATPDVDGTGLGPDPAATRRLLEEAAGAGVEHVVLLSSATVYGAWANNPVPLTEDAPLRPLPDLPFAAGRAEEERTAAGWADSEPGRRLAVLRPCVCTAEETQEWMARSPWPRVGPQPPEHQAPAQFLHLDDLASALVAAAVQRLDGVFNVAPDGWLPAEGLRALVSPTPLVRVPEPVAARVARVRWRLGRASVPPAALAYTTQPWVVANDRLRAAGWAPGHSNEEAFVAGHRAGALAAMSPRQRQELSLLATAASVAGVVAGAAVGLRRRRR
jgi:nucleoside-diphosphate-sugar epimerase